VKIIPRIKTGTVLFEKAQCTKAQSAKGWQCVCVTSGVTNRRGINYCTNSQYQKQQQHHAACGTKFFTVTRKRVKNALKAVFS